MDREFGVSTFTGIGSSSSSLSEAFPQLRVLAGIGAMTGTLPANGGFSQVAMEARYSDAAANTNALFSELGQLSLNYEGDFVTGTEL